jgi:hypothetical protein
MSVNNISIIIGEEIHLKVVKVQVDFDLDYGVYMCLKGDCEVDILNSKIFK